MFFFYSLLWHLQSRSTNFLPLSIPGLTPYHYKHVPAVHPATLPTRVHLPFDASGDIPRQRTRTSRPIRPSTPCKQGLLGDALLPKRIPNTSPLCTYHLLSFPLRFRSLSIFFCFFSALVIFLFYYFLGILSVTNVATDRLTEHHIARQLRQDLSPQGWRSGLCGH